MITAEQAKAITDTHLKMIPMDYIFQRIENKAKEGLNRVYLEGYIVEAQKKELLELGYLVELVRDGIILNW